jgi:hypothetical protein
MLAARDIDDWGRNSADAPAELPRLVRRLIVRDPGIWSAGIPAGASILKPGWDGICDSVNGNAWVPVGRSYWEMSCRADVDAKVSEDYRKRLRETGSDERSRSTFVFVSARNWPRESKWIADTKDKGEWGDIRAYDPDDLEQWLEAEHSVALAFAEELGRRGAGVESPETYWKTWAARAREPLKPQSVFREKTRDALVSKLRAQLQ